MADVKPNELNLAEVEAKPVGRHPGRQGLRGPSQSMAQEVRRGAGSEVKII